ncbi:adenylate/guanylate cyclase domain-containing protein [Algoriphagus persicinus]|uniref:adenylate/guanylate cyclase domain-containing protein n=1 Tax=Algoriphagus persicinus TaxID=3108754 RepID=UPI002B3F7438|nr:adenylate/guanylate cyclase domain-containing protein [Algoriphagus sp. E1-3-M2]MEB2785967.1 adenylate/guanylate cyclase domain-containing protein [Algoriphagus sp. E1-3-M2]
MNQELNRKQSIVYFSDIVGYTLLMGQDEDQAFELMKQNLDLHNRILHKYHGLVIKELGDGILATFETAEEALKASLEIQQEWIKRGDLKLRIGLHCGGVILDHGDVYGDAVNIASRVQSIGVPSCVLFSSKVLEELPPNSSLSHVSLGSFRLKNVTKALELFALSNRPLAIPKRKEMIQTVKSQEKEPWKFWAGLAVSFVLSVFLIYSLLWNEYTWEKDKSVAVLPFANIITNPDLAFFADGLTEDIISHLSKIESIKVIDKDAVSNYQDSDIPIDSIAKILDVTTILKGSIEWIGDKIRINVQMIDPIENKNLWTETFNREVKDIFKVQTEIASKIATVLNSNLSSKEKEQISKEQTNSFEAYELYLKAKESYGKSTKSETLEAIRYYKAALEIDPNYALAYTGLADSYARLVYFGEGENWLDSSLNASAHALDIDQYLGEAFKSRGSVYYYQGKIEYAQISLEKALVLNPNFSGAMGNLATVYMTQGELIPALELQIKSASLNPSNYIPSQITGWIYRILDHPKLAIDWLEASKAITFDAVTCEQLAYVYLEQGKMREAIRIVDSILENNPTNSVYNYSSAGYISFMAGDMDRSIELFEKILALNPNTLNDIYDSTPIFLAYAYLQKGYEQQAKELIASAIEARENSVESIKNDSNLWFDLAQLEGIRKNKTKLVQYLGQAFSTGFRDEFQIRANPIFRDYLKDPALQSILNQIDEKLYEQNQQLQSNDLNQGK